MKEYDVIVVGAGPAGCVAAKAASRHGVRVILIEEHQAIGSPRHCPGRLHSSSFTREIVKDLDPRVIVCEYRSRRFRHQGQAFWNPQAGGAHPARRDSFRWFPG